jgi:type IV pilus assembly protein PilM
LTGGGAKLSGLTSVMHERLGVPVELADPFRNFRVNKSVDRGSLAELAPLLGVAVGLAIRRIGDK